ncbi:hypothetical protein ASPVEDRAFT_43631 [Aspergillus versicolor CBS 583.65]|uniref:Uncharacterized protein n=1 Tax=Aspergillus versicolor CBS 583.65 TaxID=1036611 RepID=A0A1L9PRT3_ASPVE|nr:uncharacterized protein ASPVEDRAFT_43631 [Aspergillus versicolor CBS 583.65]OJJ04166.1 hypothetical protein ASPVEDRAFT_43631 [Aspergillus versicolor CBS 583.65]
MCAAFSNPNHGGPGYGFNYPPHPPQPVPGGYGPAPVPGGYHAGPPPGPGYGYPPPPPPYGPQNTYNSTPPPGPIPPNRFGFHPSPGPGPGPANNMNMNMNMPHQHQHQPHQQSKPGAFVLRQSPSTHKIILIHPSGTPATAPPIYSLTSSPKASKADYVLARGSDPNNASALVGEVKAHTFSSKYDLIVRGQKCLLKASSLGDSYAIDVPGRGKYRWVTDQENLSSKMWLKDEGKTRVFATYDKSRGPSSVGGWKKFVGGRDRELVLEPAIQGDEFLVEVLLVSLYAVKMAKEGALEAAGEIVGALAGA